MLNKNHANYVFSNMISTDRTPSGKSYTSNTSVHPDDMRITCTNCPSVEENYVIHWRCWQMLYAFIFHKMLKIQFEHKNINIL